MKKKLAIAAGIVVAVLCAIELGGWYYFQTHFLPNTTFNGTDVGLQTTEQAQAALDSSLAQYTLTVTGTAADAQTKDTITAQQINMAYEYGNSDTADSTGSGSAVGTEETLTDVMSSQNSAAWVIAFFAKPDAHELPITWDEDSLKETVSEMQCMNPENPIESEDARLEYKDGAFTDVAEVYGNLIDEETLEETLLTQLRDGNTEYEIDCYIQPKLTVESDTFAKCKQDIENIIQTSITLKRQNDSDDIAVTLSQDDIASVLTIGEDLTVSVDTDALRDYVKTTLREAFNTVGDTRTVSTVGCGEFTISGGIYGYLIDVDGETEQLAQDILSGDTIERAPIYSQEETYTTNGGLGDTYIDVSISQQRVWLVYGGEVIVDTPCVTGNVNNGTETPTGTYWIEFKRRNYDMPKYGVSVSYWLPIDTSTGVGLHDASWRSTFGGNYYISTGSHGCINLPVSAARTIYNNCFGTMPVVVH